MFPLPPSTEVDWNCIGLQGFDRASHVESTYNVSEGIWSAPRVIADPWIRVHGLSPGLNYGQQCYEGMRACRTFDNRILLFRPTKHGARLAHSADVISIPPVPEPHFLSCVNLAVASNSTFVPPADGNSLLYIRPLLFAHSAQLALAPPNEFTFAVYIQPGSAYHGVSAQDALVLDNVDRAAPLGVGHAKLGGNYAPVLRWSAQARKEGFGLTLHLDAKTHTEIDEFSTSGFMGIREESDGRVTVVAPDSKNVIDSVTSDSCLEVARSLGWTAERRAIKWEELHTFTEVMAVGTATLLLPIRSIVRRTTEERIVYREGSTEGGPCCEKLRKTMDDIIRGRVEGPAGWCVPVFDAIPSSGVVDDVLVGKVNHEECIPAFGDDNAGVPMTVDRSTVMVVETSGEVVDIQDSALVEALADIEAAPSLEPPSVAAVPIVLLPMEVETPRTVSISTLEEKTPLIISTVAVQETGV